MSLKRHLKELTLTAGYIAGVARVGADTRAGGLIQVPAD